MEVTDWVSALSDAVMALMAIAGFILALNWKREATREMAIGYCSNILSESLPFFQKASGILTHETILITYMKSLTENDRAMYNFLSDVYKLGKTFNSECEIRHKHFTSLTSEYNKLISLSWKVVDEKESTFKEMISCLNDISSKEIAANAEIILFFRQWDDNLFDDGLLEHITLGHTSYSVLNKIHINKASKLLSEIIDLKVNLQEKFSVLNINNSTIFDLFEAKK